MRISPSSLTSNFQARIKLNSPKLQKLKDETVILKEIPEVKKTVVSGLFSFGGTATFCLGNYVESIREIPVLNEGLPLSGTIIANFPMSVGIVAEANKDSGTNSSISLEESLFYRDMNKDKKMPS